MSVDVGVGDMAPQEVAKWWERFQEASPDEREEMLVSEEAGPKKKRQ